GNDNNNRYNEKEDPRYITQTYKFSLDTLNEVYNDLINNPIFKIVLLLLYIK
ncbi:2820_t:CDS:2, partial [Rhizophagus irregularis]